MNERDGLPAPEAGEDKTVTLVFSELVREGRISEYEAWAHDLHDQMGARPGFLGVTVIRPRDPGHPEYVTIVRFQSYETLREWQQSAAYAVALARLRDLIVGEGQQQHAEGLQLWFDRPSGPAPTPAFYKQVVVGVIGVYPLILLFGAVTEPLTRALPAPVSVLITAALATVFLTYPVLPLLTRWLRPWLYP